MLLLCVLLSGCARLLPSRRTPVLTKSAFFLDTAISISLYDSADEALIDAAFDLCDAYEQRLSRTIPGSEVYALNHADGAPVRVSADTADMLTRALAYSALTVGAYDVTVAPLMELWGFGTEGASPPSQQALDATLAQVGYENITLEGDSVTLGGGARIDLGSIAKGYIGDVVADYLRAQGVKSAIVDLGGNVVTIGTKPDGKPFSVGIQKPFAKRGEVLETLYVRDMAVVTSGVYERFFRWEDKLYHHILDARTGMPAENGLLCVTVVTPSSYLADALSTPLFLLGAEYGVAYVETLENVECMYITDDGARIYSSGFMRMVGERG